MGMRSAYILAGLSEDDALKVAENKRAEALELLNSAQEEFSDWDAAYAKLLAAWANKYYGQPQKDSA